MKDRLKELFWATLPLIVAFIIGYFIISPFAQRMILKSAKEKFERQIIHPYLDSVYSQGFELGKISAIWSMVKVIDSSGIERPVPWNIRRVMEKADSIRDQPKLKRGKDE